MERVPDSAVMTPEPSSPAPAPFACLTIGGMRFTVTGSLPDEPLPEPYDGFVDCPPPAGTSGDYHVEIVPVSQPLSPPDRPPLFASHQSWSLYRKQGAYHVILQPEGARHPLWDARFHPDDPLVRVRCWPGMDDAEASRMGRVPANPMTYPLDQILTARRGSGA